MILRHLPRWRDRVLNLLNDPCVQWQCLWGAFTPVCLTLLQYIAKIQKWIPKFFAVSLVDLPRFCTALTSRSSASRRVVLLSDLFLLVRIILFLKMEKRKQTAKKLTHKPPTERGVGWQIEPNSPTLRVPICHPVTFSCFRLHHPQTQEKSTILMGFQSYPKGGTLHGWHTITCSCNHTMGGTLSHVAVTTPWVAQYHM
jgi:hypothetical protein